MPWHLYYRANVNLTRNTTTRQSCPSDYTMVLKLYRERGGKMPHILDEGTIWSCHSITLRLLYLRERISGTPWLEAAHGPHSRSGHDGEEISVLILNGILVVHHVTSHLTDILKEHSSHIFTASTTKYLLRYNINRLTIPRIGDFSTSQYGRPQWVAGPVQRSDLCYFCDSKINPSISWREVWRTSFFFFLWVLHDEWTGTPGPFAKCLGLPGLNETTAMRTGND